MTLPLPPRAAGAGARAAPAVAALALLALLAAPHAGAAPLAEYGYRCTDGRRFDVAYASGPSGGSAMLTLPGAVRVLPQVPAASGVRFSDGAWTLVGRGLEASLQAPAGGPAPWTDCAAVVRRTVDAATGLRFEWPARWTDARVASFATPGEPGPAGVPIRYDFVLVPVDAAAPQAPLATVTAWPRAAWTGLAPVARAAAGIEAAANDAWVFAAALAPANPYAPRSEDARRFAALAPGRDELVAALAGSVQANPVQADAGQPAGAPAAVGSASAPPAAVATPVPAMPVPTTPGKPPARPAAPGSAPAVAAAAPASAILPLRCDGRDPSWSLRIGADGAGSFTRRVDGGSRNATLSGALTRIDAGAGAPGHAVWRARSGGDNVWVAMLRGERCSDGAADADGGWRVLLSTPRDEVLSGCCRGTGP